jgi:hypothetical protein
MVTLQGCFRVRMLFDLPLIQAARATSESDQQIIALIPIRLPILVTIWLTNLLSNKQLKSSNFGIVKAFKGATLVLEAS